MMLRRYVKSIKKAVRRLQNRLFAGRKILVLGDSHCGIFEYCFDQGLLVPHLVNCEIVAGATAYGLNNDVSQTGAWQKFERALRRFAHFDVVVLMLGECDCSFALPKKAERLNVSPESLIDQSLAGLRRLVVKVRGDTAAPGRRIILVGAILPTIDDGAAASQENVLRREIRTSQAERTRLVLSFNEKLRQLADDMQVGYFDLTAQTMNPETGLVDRRYVASAEDHHLSHPASAPLWARGLLNCL
jgi:hypothetical protein